MMSADWIASIMATALAAVLDELHAARLCC
jgi:hypothetical protein